MISIDPDLGLDVATDAVARAMKAGADEASVVHSYSEVFEVNFDTNDVTLVRSTVGDALSLTLLCDRRKGTAQLTGRSHDLIEQAVAQALEAAQAGEADDANVLPQSPVERAADRGHEQPDREAMVDAVLRLIAEAKERYPALRSDSSTYSFRSSWASYANSHDRLQHARLGLYVAVLMVTGKDDTQATSFNYVHQVGAEPFDSLLAVPVVERMIESTMASFDAQPISSTFVGDVIFTPESLDTLVGSIAGALSGPALMRKTTPYLDRLGEAIAAPMFTLRHAPSALAAASAFDSDGFVNADLPVITEGALENYLVDWYFSNKLGVPRTTGLTDWVIDPGDVALDDLIASTERGIVLGRYSGGMPNQKLDFSGVAKNSFYVEDGKIVHPLAETMITGNFVTALESIRGISRETLDFGSAAYPWVSVGDVTISTN